MEENKKKYLRTPIIYPRSQGGTFYTFGSALEDIGLNINELNNKVRMSHYVLLDIPDFTKEDVKATGTTYNTNGDKIFADGFQNYVLNMETLLRNQPNYSYAESASVSERIFWKWLKPFMSFTATKDGYYTESGQVVKAFGAISAGAQRTDEYNIYNETFVQIPSSFGQMDVLFYPYTDKNYYISDAPFKTTNDEYPDKIENCINPSEDLTNVGLSNTASYDPNVKGYLISDDQDCLCVEFDLNKLRAYYDNEYLTYDDLAINSDYRPTLNKKEPADYEFNAILVYYSIYDTNNNIIATNAYGLLLLDKAQGTEQFSIPSYNKKESSANSDGTSFSFRINIKTSSVYNGDVVLYDNSTPAFSAATDFNDVLRNLTNAVETLKSNANVIRTIASDNMTIKSMYSVAINKMDTVLKEVASIKQQNSKNINAENISAKTINAEQLTSNIDIIDASSGETTGNISKDTITYNKINTKEIQSETIATVKTKTNNIVSVSRGEPISIGNETTQYASFQESGIYTNSVYSGVPKEGSPVYNLSKDDIKKIFNSITIIDTGDGYRLSIPQPSNINNSAETDILNKLSNSSYNDILSIIAVMIAYIKTL